MFVVNIMQREHGAAVEQELGGEGLKAYIFQGDAERWLVAASEGGYGRKEKDAGQPGEEEAVQCRNG